MILWQSIGHAALRYYIDKLKLILLNRFVTGSEFQTLGDLSYSCKKDIASAAQNEVTITINSRKMIRITQFTREFIVSGSLIGLFTELLCRRNIK